MGDEIMLEKSFRRHMPPLREDACWRAFDLLSQSRSTISDVTLCRLFAPAELERLLACDADGRGHTVFSRVGQAQKAAARSREHGCFDTFCILASHRRAVGSVALEMLGCLTRLCFAASTV